MTKTFRFIYSASLILIIAGLFFACSESGADAKAEKTMSKEELIKKGEYLVSVMGCEDCHSPKVFGPNGPEPDMGKYLSGHPQDAKPEEIKPEMTTGPWVMLSMDGTTAVGPWGVSFSANITSDETGIGNWTEEQFERAFRQGWYKGIEGGRKLLPPMPWPVYSKMKDEDVKAIFYYLKSMKPVKNIVPAAIPPNQLTSTN